MKTSAPPPSGAASNSACSRARKYDGLFGIWYGKAPGVDRTGDVFKHANAAGSSALGGVLAIVGDDHNCKSSTLPSQSEFAMMDAEIPVLNPASIQDVLDYRYPWLGDEPLFRRLGWHGGAGRYDGFRLCGRRRDLDRFKYRPAGLRSA
jgi:hypothetical protein